MATLEKSASQTKLNIATSKQALSKAWIKAAGILKGKKINPLHYQKQIRKEWEKRIKK